jgi:hypothetical protein
VCENDELMVHPSDRDALKALDTFDPDFAAEPSNVRIGLTIDGFTPFGQMASSYSCWHVFVIPYNLPPSLFMKYGFIFLFLIIPGPNHPGKKLNIMLKPLIEELKELWKGVEAYDVFTNIYSNFVSRICGRCMPSCRMLFLPVGVHIVD